MKRISSDYLIRIKKPKQTQLIHTFKACEID